jgi:hypothetical protein
MRLNSLETAPAATLEQGPGHTQEDTQEEGAADTGHEGLNSAIEVYNVQPARLQGSTLYTPRSS